MSSLSWQVCVSNKIGCIQNSIWSEFYMFEVPPFETYAFLQCSSHREMKLEHFHDDISDNFVTELLTSKLLSTMHGLAIL